MTFIWAASAAVIGGAGCSPADSVIAGGAEGAPERATPLRADVEGTDAPERGGGTPSRGDGQTPIGAARGLSVLAWNMERFPLTPVAPDHIEDVIQEMQPDIVGVAEIADDWAFLDMVDSIRGYAAVIADDPWSDTRVGMVYRRDRVTVSDIETLFKDDQYNFPRPPLKVHVEVDGAGFDFDFVAVHLKARMDPSSKARRKAAIDTLEAWVDERLDDGADPDIMIAGDWNDMITASRSQNVFRPFLDDPDRYHFLTQEVADAGDYSCIPWGSLIDHVLVTTPLLDVYGEGSTHALHLEDSVADYVEDVSDHRPIRVQFAHP